MKQCPRCSRSYADETLNFCLEDGEWLLTDDEPATAIQSAPQALASGVVTEQGAVPTTPNSGEPATKVFSNITDQTAEIRVPERYKQAVDVYSQRSQTIQDNKVQVIAPFEGVSVFRLS